jgi:hypothetical protein
MRSDAVAPRLGRRRYVICVGSFEDFFGVLLDPGGEGRPHSLRNAVDFAAAASSDPESSVCIAYDDAGPEETMAEWLLNKALTLIDACEALGTWDAGRAMEINPEVARIERGRRDLSAVDSLLCRCDMLRDTLFADDVSGLLELAISTNERVRLSLELFRARKKELGLVHRAATLVLTRDFEIAVLKRCGDRLKSEHRDKLRSGFQSALATISEPVALRCLTAITARAGNSSSAGVASTSAGVAPTSAGVAPTSAGVAPTSAGGSSEATRWGHGITAFARRLDGSAVAEELIKATCNNLGDESRAIVSEMVATVFREFPY